LSSTARFSPLPSSFDQAKSTAMSYSPFRSCIRATTYLYWGLWTIPHQQTAPQCRRSRGRHQFL
jgi:hypothetical protein